MPHAPPWHILDDVFTEQNSGIPTPTRREGLEAGSVLYQCGSGASHELTCEVNYSLRIRNLDRADPPGYTPNSVPRARDFNRNLFDLAADARMPEIAVECEAVGFDPAVSPIYWKLQCRHVMCRHTNQGHYRYRGACEIMEREWQGRSRAASFTLFQRTTSEHLQYDFNSNEPDGPVVGGHAILCVSARPTSSDTTLVLLDYVHLRIRGTNPILATVLGFIRDSLADRNNLITTMVRAVFAHEANFIQFRNVPQTVAHMTFRAVHHGNDPTQPDCRVRFDWPDDPARFPLATFDFGVGISQYTKLRGRTIGAGVAWDWRENVKIGINVFLDALRASHTAGLTWSQWAWRAWRRYNGGGPQAGAYANTLQASAEGSTIPNTAVPGTLDLAAETHHLVLVPESAPAPAWPP